MKTHQLLMILANIYLAAVFAVEDMSVAAFTTGVIFGAAAIIGQWRGQ